MYVGFFRQLLLHCCYVSLEILIIRTVSQSSTPIAFAAQRIFTLTSLFTCKKTSLSSASCLKLPTQQHCCTQEKDKKFMPEVPSFKSFQRHLITFFLLFVLQETHMHMIFPSSRCKVSQPRGGEFLRSAAASRQGKGKTTVGYPRTYFIKKGKKTLKEQRII